MRIIITGWLTTGWRARAAWAALCVAIALEMVSQPAERIAPAKFAELTMKLMSSDTALQARLNRGAPIVVVGPPVPATGSCASCAVAAEIAAAFRVNLRTAPASCALDSLGLTAGIAAIVAVDLPSSCVQNISRVAQRNRILTVSTQKEHVDPLSMAVILEHGLVQVYRSDRALSKEGIRLSRDTIALTRMAVDYRENYREAIRATDFRNWNEAARRLKMAIAGQSQEGGLILIYGTRNETYLPHYFLGIALSNMGRCDEALDEWRKSEEQGAIRRSTEYKKLAGHRKRCGAPPTIAVQPTGSAGGGE